jgi:collagenase-like PrtC family protease
MVKYTVAANWDLKLLDEVVGTSVTGLFGQIPDDIIGGGRPSFLLPQVTREEASEYIRETRKRGLEFNYLLNASCLDNLELTRQKNKEIMQHLEWVSNTGANMVTVSLPILLKLLKRHFPHIKVAVSSFANVENVQRAKYWEALGADKLILKENIARDFEMLREIRKNVRCSLELIANHSCLFYCPFSLNHNNLMSHSSQKGHPSGGFLIDYCLIFCQMTKLQNPEELIKARWIRPEDVGVYEEVGVDYLKLIERFRTTESLIRIIKTYAQQRFDGNFAELLTLPSKDAFRKVRVSYLSKPEFVDISKLLSIAQIMEYSFAETVHIDNRKLDGFIDFFFEKDCFHSSCDDCGYCAEIAKKAISINEKEKREILQRYDHVINALLAGNIF